MQILRIRRAALTAAAAVVIAAAAQVQPAFAQGSRSFEAQTTIDVDTTLAVRTTEAIDVKTADGLVIRGHH